MSGTKIIKLDLSNNEISDAGGELIAEALQKTSSIISLNLSRNDLKISSAAMFVTAVEMNETIKYLMLEDNCITTDFINIINDHLRNN